MTPQNILRVKPKRERKRALLLSLIFLPFLATFVLVFLFGSLLGKKGSLFLFLLFSLFYSLNLILMLIFDIFLVKDIFVLEFDFLLILEIQLFSYDFLFDGLTILFLMLFVIVFLSLSWFIFIRQAICIMILSFIRFITFLTLFTFFTLFCLL